MLLVLLSAIFLNGVNIDGLRGQSFEKCKAVRIDDKGDVHLDCPGYQVENAPAAPVVPVAASSLAAASVTKHYWLVTEQAQGDSVQYDLDLFINSKWIRKLRSGEDQVVLDVTKYLAPGQNKVLFAATKRLETGRKSTSAAAYLKVIVGEGEAGGNHVLIDNPLVELKRTAAETDNVNEEFTIQGR